VKAVVYHPQAEAEVIEATRYYESRSAGLGFVFLAEMQRAENRIAANPEASPRVRGDIRRTLLRRFPYGLMYADEADRIRVIALAHSKRRPFYWWNRVN
jgi:toxin ParE1/3/4